MRGKQKISCLLLVALFLGHLHVPTRALAEESDIIEPPFDAIDVRASRFEKFLEGKHETEELEYWAAFLLAAGLLVKTVTTTPVALVKTIINIVQTRAKKADLERAQQRAAARHKERLDELEKAAKAYEQARTAWEADKKNKSKLNKLKQAGKRVADTFNSIVDLENKDLPPLKRQGTLNYNTEKQGFFLNDPLGQKVEIAREQLNEELKQKVHTACAEGYGSLVDDISKMRWQRAAEWTWPAVYATGFAGSAYWWRSVADRRKRHNGGKSVLEIHSDKIKENATRLQKATDLSHQLATWDDPKYMGIKKEFTAITMEVLRHNEARIIEYYEKHVPKEVQAMLSVRDIIHNSLHGEHAKAMLENVLPKSMATAAKATLGEASPEDVMGIIGTKDIAKQETDTKSFLIIMYAELFNRLWPKLAFKNTNGDAHMILISPIINDSLNRMRGLKLKIQKQQKEDEKAAAEVGQQGAALPQQSGAEGRLPSESVSTLAPAKPSTELVSSSPAAALPATLPVGTLLEMP